MFTDFFYTVFYALVSCALLFRTPFNYISLTSSYNTRYFLATRLDGENRRFWFSDSKNKVECRPWVWTTLRLNSMDG